MCAAAPPADPLCRHGHGFIRSDSDDDGGAAAACCVRLLQREMSLLLLLFHSAMFTRHTLFLN